VAVLAGLREDHGYRLKGSQKTAVEMALSVRLQWARGSWQAPLEKAWGCCGPLPEMVTDLSTNFS